MGISRISFVLLLCVVGCERSASDNASTQPAGVETKDIARNYNSLTLMTKEPVTVSAQLAMLCRGADQKDINRAKKTDGPHAYTDVRIFMNESAAKTFNAGTGSYPVGSIIIKEKTGRDYKGQDRTVISRTHDGVGGMIKRGAGYDTDYGNWEYFYFERADEVETGRIESCIACHANAFKDHVFGNWAKPDADLQKP